MGLKWSTDVNSAKSVIGLTAVVKLYSSSTFAFSYLIIFGHTTQKAFQSVDVTPREHKIEI